MRPGDGRLAIEPPEGSARGGTAQHLVNVLGVRLIDIIAFL